MVNAVPVALTPYLCVADARAAIAWWTEVLGATITTGPIVMDDGRVGHAELAWGEARWMVSEEFESAGVAPPDPARGAGMSLHLDVPDVDALCARLVTAGTTLDRGPEDAGSVGRVAVFRDPAGHRWFLNQRPRETGGQ